jgi:L-amino acid N-acyltransferase
MNISILYRKATIADAAEIRNILGYYIENTLATWRYSVMDLNVFEGWIQNHQTPQRPFWVAEQDRQVVGYSCLSDFRNGEGYWPCAEDSVYVRPECCGLGIGSRLMQLIIDQGRDAGLQAILAGIDAENGGSIRFHEKFGFYICGELKNIGWKKESKRSLIFMQRDLQPDDDRTEPISIESQLLGMRRQNQD